jgi:hypothetical protein
MTERLPHNIAERLIRVLGMLGSDCAGERAAAGLLADKMVKERGLCWRDVIMPTPPAPWHEPETIEAKHDFLLDHSDQLTPWERRFVASVSGFARLSDRQTEVIDQLVEKVRDLAGERAA